MTGSESLFAARREQLRRAVEDGERLYRKRMHDSDGSGLTIEEEFRVDGILTRELESALALIDELLGSAPAGDQPSGDPDSPRRLSGHGSGASGHSERKLPCGCYAEYRQGNALGSWSISAVAFLCEQDHKQLDVVNLVGLDV